MDDTFFAYLQRLELMAFFTGYPLFYALIRLLAGNSAIKNEFRNRLVRCLPIAYALVGTLYLGLQLKNLYPDYSIANLKLAMQHPYLKIWALLSLLFWISALRKKPALSLLHSLVFFFFLLKDIFDQSYSASADKSVVRNDMKLYTDSLLLNLAAYAVIFTLSYLFRHFNKRTRF
jgi:hypothetical protein